MDTLECVSYPTVSTIGANLQSLWPGNLEPWRLASKKVFEFSVRRAWIESVLEGSCVGDRWSKKSEHHHTSGKSKQNDGEIR